MHFVLDGEVVRIADPSPTMTVLEYLREVLGRTGTKEGCAEGDCGACTVVLGNLAAGGNHIEYRAVNSCIRFLPTIDGQELVTVESLQGDGGALHPVQQAMVDHHASQCGFCTPGFVMSLFALYLNQETSPREDVITALSGNLCRCTGYRPIIAAGCGMGSYARPSRWSREDGQSPARRDALRALRRDESLALRGFQAPRTCAQLARALQAEPRSLVLAGGTDVGLWVTKQLRELPEIVYLGEADDLKQIVSGTDGLEIGAAVSLAEAWRAVVELYPQLHDLALRFASPPVCNAGTLCGNIANGSPVGDSMPILIALGSELTLRLGDATRRIPLEKFYLGFQRRDLKPGEFIVSVTVPRPRVAQRIASYKVSKRFDQDIAAVCAGFVVDFDGPCIVTARIVFGGMAAVPARARSVEEALVGKKLTPQMAESAASALAHDFEPLTDLRASNHYRLLVAGNLLRRFFFDGGPHENLRITDPS